LIDAQLQFQVRLQAMAYAMQTATPGEGAGCIAARAIFYAEWMLEPLTLKAKADALGEPASQVLN
jgi:hypothetical protein